MKQKRLFFYHNQLKCIFLILLDDQYVHLMEGQRYSPLCLPLTPVHGYSSTNEYYYCHAPKDILYRLDNVIQKILSGREHKDSIKHHLYSVKLESHYPPVTFYPLYRRMVWIRNEKQLNHCLTERNIDVTKQQEQQVKDLYRKLHAIGEPADSIYLSTPF